MKAFKNTSGGPMNIPQLRTVDGLETNVPADGTVEVPDELAAQFDANPNWTASRTKHPDVSVDPEAAQSFAPTEQAIAPSSTAVAPAAPPAD